MYIKILCFYKSKYDLYQKFAVYFVAKMNLKPFFFHDSGYLTLQDRQLYRSEEVQVEEKQDNEVQKYANICSWNIQELFLYHSLSKLNNILYHINCLDAEVLCLQEVFEPDTIRVYYS